MRGFGRSAALSIMSAASLMFVLGGCAAPETVSRDIHVKRGVTLEDDLIHFYGAPSQRIIRGESEYFVYNARTMNITSADGSSCRGTPVFIFSYDTKKLSDLKCRESIPPEELSSRAGDSVVVGVSDTGDAPMYDGSSTETSADGAYTQNGAALAPAAGVGGVNEAAVAGPLADGSVPVEDLGESTGADEGVSAGGSSLDADGGSPAGGSGSAGGSGDAGSADGALDSPDEISLAGDDGGMQIINK